ELMCGDGERRERRMERTDKVSVEQQQAWGKLVRVGESTESALTLLLVNKECTVGRRKGGEELWYCMRKSGVAEKYVRVVQDMYERSRTVVRCAVGQTEEFNVEVGLHQGSALSPFLFAIVMDQSSEEVRQESPWTMMFADDIVICSESREQVEENLERWRFALERRGMKVSGSKTEYMCVNEREGSGTVRLQGEEVKKVQEFKFLGSTVQSNGECGKEVKKRVQAGWNGWRKVSGVLCERKISARIKGKVYRTVVRAAMLYGLETVSLRKRQESELEVAELKMLRFSLGVTRLDRIRNEYIRGTAHVGRLGDKVREARLRWFGHVQRRESCDLSFPASKLVSGDHCKITQDQESGQVWLEDTSTNGTVINMSKLVKRQSHLLQSGDVIYFVYRKSEPEQNIAYVYHSMTPSHSDSQDTEGECCWFSEVRSVQSSVKRPDGESERDECEQPERKRQKTVCVYDPYVVYPAVGEPHTPAVPPKSGKDGGEGSKADKMEESLTCIICQDLLYDCVSLQPCMHTFCAACYSGWMERSSLCPTCRCPVERIRKNHILNNLVEAYLLQHPEKCRSEEDMRSMDTRNKITQDMLQPKVERYFSDEEGSSDYLFELSDNDSDTSDLRQLITQPYMTCRQCPGYKKDFSPAPWICGSTGETGPTPGDGPSTSSDTCTEAQEFTCPSHGSHLICTCCLQPMPDRRAEHVGTNSSPQHCLVCQRPFCHLYWGCQRIGCQGCLARFSDLNLTDKCLDGVLNNNHYESEILQNYLSSRGKTWKEMLQEALQSTQQGLYHLSDYRINGKSFLCYCCGLRFFKELAYAYRANIPAAELPASATR
ncbi:hypothetical protein QTP86_034176, partial [Hemibagrus guttatus]